MNEILFGWDVGMMYSTVFMVGEPSKCSMLHLTVLK